MNNDIENAYKIAIKLNNEEELFELSKLTEIYNYVFSKHSNHSYPFILVIGIDILYDNYISKESYFSVIKNDKIPVYMSVCDGIYYQIFVYKQNSININKILKTKKIIKPIIVDYNTPRQLVYEKKGDINSYEICIKVNNKNELLELENLYNECGFNSKFYNIYKDKFDSNEFIYIFLNIKIPGYGWECEDAYDEYNFKSGIVNDDNMAFDFTYYKIFDIKDILKIKNILKNKKIPLSIDYNTPRQLVYENNNGNDATEICIKVNNKEELYIICELCNKFGYTIDSQVYKDFFNYNDFYYIFLDFKEFDYSYTGGDAYDKYDFKSGFISSDYRYFDNVYHKIFDINKDYLVIYNLLKNKKVVVDVGYNKPRQLVYENKITRYSDKK